MEVLNTILTLSDTTYRITIKKHGRSGILRKGYTEWIGVRLCSLSLLAGQNKQRDQLTGDVLKAVPEVSHGSTGDDVTWPAVHQVVLQVAKVLVEEVRMPQVLIQLLVHVAHQDRLLGKNKSRRNEFWKISREQIFGIFAVTPMYSFLREWWWPWKWPAMFWNIVTESFCSKVFVYYFMLLKF